MRQRYLKEHRPGLYSSLILSEKLYPHLLEIDRAARERMDAMLPRMMEAAGVTEELKAHDPMSKGTTFHTQLKTREQNNISWPPSKSLIVWAFRAFSIFRELGGIGCQQLTSHGGDHTVP